jgi:hypothetical protein
MRKAGAKDLFLLLDPADIPGPPVAVVPLGEGADSKAIGQILCGGGEKRPVFAWPTCATVHHAVFAGTAAALERIRQAPKGNPPRPELAEAFAAAGNAPVRILILPSDDHRRILEEMLPNLPREVGNGPITVVSRGARWASISFDAEPKPRAQVVVRSQDADAAKALARVAQNALKVLAQAIPQKGPQAELARDVARLEPRAENDRVRLDVDLEKLSSLVSIPLRQAREASHRTNCVNNLKYIGLAMHNYLSAHQTFPPPASRDKEGRPLLSWRVHVLPYLEQQSLYKEFHLDEPWDSPHNKTLIPRMPKIYVCPSGSRKVAASGRTSYLVPRGKGTIFPGGEGIKIKEITDGTSNTILVVEANDDSAVIWTKPDDWEVDPEPRKQTLFGHHPGGTNLGIADGSVRFVRDTIDPAVLRKLLTRDGGEVISADEF